jgi:hypothetical protein
VLRAVLWISAAAGSASFALVLALFFVPIIPLQVAWGIAFLVVLLAMLALAVLVWTILTLPPRAPFRVLGLRVCAGALALATLGLLLGVGSRGWRPPALGGAALALVSAMLARET